LVNDLSWKGDDAVTPSKIRIALSLICALLAVALVPVLAPQPVSASGGGPVGGTFTIANDVADEIQPAVAYNPDRQEYLVVWHRDVGYADIRARRVSKQGTPLGNVFVVDGGEFRELRYPDVAYSPDDQEYLVVWQETSQTPPNPTTVRARRVSGTGNPMASSFDIFGTDPSQAPAVAYATTSQMFLVVWEWFDFTGNSIAARTYDPDVGPGTTHYVYEDTTGAGAYQPDVAYCRTRNEHLVVWRQDSAGIDSDIHARRVPGNGAPLPGTLFVSTLGHDEQRPAVAALPLVNNQGNYLVSWELDIGTSMNVMARSVEIASDGSASMGVQWPLAATDEDEVKPAVGASESRGQYLVTWQQQVFHDIPGGGGWVNDPIVGRPLASDGTPQGSTFTEIGEYDAGWSAVAAGGVGNYLVAFEDTPSGGSVNVYGHMWGDRIYLPLVMRQ
jgi:hypothetical protein